MQESSESSTSKATETRDDINIHQIIPNEFELSKGIENDFQKLTKLHWFR